MFVTVGLAILSGSIGSLVDTNGDAMMPEEVKPPDPEPSAKNEETQPEDWSEEDPDTARGEAFKRMFPDIPDRAKKPTQ